MEVRNDHHAYELTADHILIATGSTPAHAPGIPVDGQRVFDTDALPHLQQIPRELIVVGASVIGLEYASMMAAMNRRVTIVDQRSVILEFADVEIVEALCYQLRRRGAVFRLGERVERVRRDERDHVVAELGSGKTVHGDVLVYAVGRQANTAQLNLDAVGLVADARGRLTVNAHYQTAVPHISAAGDVIGFPALASTSMEQARVAACHAFGLAYKSPILSLLPYGIYTIPEVSCVGETEESLRERRVDYVAGRAFYRDNARGQITGDLEGMTKLLVHVRTRRLVGVHVIGERATELVHVGQAVMQLGGNVDTFIDMVFNYPTLGESFKYAAYAALGALRKRELT
mgnify:CR=1 FL=1